MVTHDVDEALFLADRIVLMTNGPAATVGEIVRMPFTRPRERLSIGDDPRYPETRGQVLTFLEERAHSRHFPELSIVKKSSVTERRAPQTNRGVTAEELFVVDKYTGFNRFRARYRRKTSMKEFTDDDRESAGSQALSSTTRL
jgi:ABC-type proline/glycine betaine transport system ATPase subunit